MEDRGAYSQKGPAMVIAADSKFLKPSIAGFSTLCRGDPARSGWST
jgi:hypothetical protein